MLHCSAWTLLILVRVSAIVSSNTRWRQFLIASKVNRLSFVAPAQVCYDRTTSFRKKSPYLPRSQLAHALARGTENKRVSCEELEYLSSGIVAWPRGYKTFFMLSSAQLRLKFILLINVKMPTIVGILTFISRINY